MEYIRIIDDYFNEKIPEGKNGVYKLCALDKNNKPIPLPRVLKTDSEGVLYIGCAPKRTLRERIADFRKCVLPKYKGKAHTAGRRYQGISSFRKNFPYDVLAFTVEVSEDPEMMEKQLIRKYMNEFGEVPPLNSY